MSKKKKILFILSNILQVVLITVCSFLIVRNVCYNAIIVSHSSMYPTLNSGDYGYAIKTKYALDHIKRFDIVIFTLDLDENDQEEDKLIKRVIGLPGETISFQGDNCDLYVNDNKISQDFIDLETQAHTGIKTYTVPENCYFVLGDNRKNSKDSRFFGCVEKNKMEGILKVITRHQNDDKSMELVPFRYY